MSFEIPFAIPSHSASSYGLGYFVKEGMVITVALVKLKEGESFEGAFRRFKKSCEKAGILSEVKKREHYEKPGIRLRKKSAAARKRAVKKLKKGE